ncbi:MAG TPA: hypothetical protein VLE99_05975 [Candidatus Saccharimonadales bacterium]|nr:hypothetical protein [Candidatus Saccharimonadales bacterium]
MRNFNRPLSGDRGGAGVEAVIAGVGLIGIYVIGWLTGFSGGYKAGENDQDNLRDVQLQQDQIQAQLAPGYPGSNNVVLNTDKHTISFTMPDPNTGGTENCTGHYQAHDTAATLMGQILCTQVVQPR